MGCEDKCLVYSAFTDLNSHQIRDVCFGCKDLKVIESTIAQQIAALHGATEDQTPGEELPPVAD